MDISTILSLSAFSLTEMDRIGVSGNKDQKDGSSEGFGFEQSLDSLLGGNLVASPQFNLLESQESHFLGNQKKEVESNLNNPLAEQADENRSQIGLNSQFLSIPNHFEKHFSDEISGSQKDLAKDLSFSTLRSNSQGEENLNLQTMKTSSESHQTMLGGLSLMKDQQVGLAGNKIPPGRDSSRSGNSWIDQPLAKGSVHEDLRASLENLSSADLANMNQGIALARAENRESIKDDHLEAGGFDEGNEFSSENSLNSFLNRDLDEALKHQAGAKDEIKTLKPMSIKSLADSLFIQGQIGSDLMSRSDSLLSESASTKNLATQVQQNLVQDMEAFISQVIETNEGGSISLKLRPGNLGEVQVRVEVEAESVRIQMDTASRFTENVLKSQSLELKQQLQSIGLKIEDLQISSSRSSESSHDSKDQRNSQNPFSQQEQRKEQQNSRKAFSLDEDAASKEV
jgi:flagellar hook-length control protein FliK